MIFSDTDWKSLRQKGTIVNDIDKLIASNPYFKDDGIKYWLVPPKGEYDFELAILFEDDYPDFTVLTWALNRKQTDETVRELFEALLRRGINIGIDTSNLEN